MNMKYNLTFAKFYPDSGISTVDISTPIGHFSGQAMLHPQDADFASNFVGCEYAERRAVIKYMKAMLAQVRIQKKTMEDFNKTIEGMKNCYYHSEESRRARRIFFDYQKQEKELKEKIARAEARLKEDMKLRDETVRKLAMWARNPAEIMDKHGK